MPSIRRNGSPSISMRSANVPLSPSSALQTTYFWSASTPATVRHLMPVGKPAPPRPRRPEASTSSTVALGPSLERALQTLEAAVAAIILERQRIGHAATREDEALLALEIGNVLDPPERLGMRAAVRKPASNSDAASCGAIGPVADAAARPSRLRPAAPARRGRASRCARSRSRARARALRARAPRRRCPRRPTAPRNRRGRRLARSLRRPLAPATIASSRSRSSRPIGSPSSKAAGDSAQLPRQ